MSSSSSSLELRTRLPHALSNTVLLPVCILLLLWFLKALHRLLRSLLLRRRVLRGGEVVEITGLGSYLSYFEEVSRTHVHSIVHTRQSKPAVLMRAALVPVSLQYLRWSSSPVSGTLSAPQTHAHKHTNTHTNTHAGTQTGTHAHTLEVRLSCTTPGQVLLLSSFSLARWKLALQQAKEQQTSAFWERQGLQWIRKTAFHAESTALSLSLACESERRTVAWLAEKECCESLCVCVEVSAGLHTLSLDLSSFVNKTASSSALDCALVFVCGSAQKEMVLLSQGPLLSSPRERERDEQAHMDTQAPREEREELTPSRSLWRTFLSSLTHNAVSTQPLAPPVPSSLSASSVDHTQIDVTHSAQAMEIVPVTLFTLSLPVSVITGNALTPRTAHKQAHTHAQQQQQQQQQQSSSVVKTEIFPKELFLLDQRASLSQSLEIFGLNSMNESSADANADANASSSSLGTVHAKPQSPQRLPSSRNGSPGSSISRISPVDTDTDNDLVRSESMHNALALNDLAPVHTRGAIAPAPLNTRASVSTRKQEGEAENEVVVPWLMISQGGQVPKDECVVCLTEPKKILLLPCRHFCVCSSCLAYVDKCPVCRALFEEYVVIDAEHKMCFPIP